MFAAFQLEEVTPENLSDITSRDFHEEWPDPLEMIQKQPELGNILNTNQNNPAEGGMLISLFHQLSVICLNFVCFVFVYFILF